jgi:hypothetical protein
MIESDVSLEFSGAALGDERLSKRLERVGTALVESPDASFPEAMRSDGQLEGLYRFLNNDKVTFDGIRAPHIEQTVERCRQEEEIFILHDTTSLEFGGKREGLGRLETSAAGFFLHASLAVTPDRRPLGALGAENLVRNGPKRKKSSKRRIKKDPRRESLRWGRAVDSCEDALGVSGHAIHVMDREGDNYDLFSQLLTSDIRFIIRAAHNRCVVGETDRLKELALKARRRFTRTVSIGPHEPFLKFDQKIHPEREAREIILAVSAMSVEIKRSNNFTITSEPIRTNAQLEKVIDGWLVLGRAMERLLILEQGYLSAKKT